MFAVALLFCPVAPDALSHAHRCIPYTPCFSLRNSIGYYLLGYNIINAPNPQILSAFMRMFFGLLIIFSSFLLK